ncbi:MAG TPA: DinB family protein [Gemmatimonadaceae bacterium]|jgi:hypothetical protein|nr:DinB family protein [Gemmatimonadaceae bacterium]
MSVQQTLPEVWLRGPLPGYSPLVMPAAHCLLQCREEIRATAADLRLDQLWLRPGGVASPGFQLRHIAGSIDRLLTYARGAQLDRAQQLALRAEGEAGTPPATAEELVAGVDAAIQAALDTLRATRESDLLHPREVGRAALPSNVLGLLFHIAEHTHRHTGQLVTTVKIIRAAPA